MNTSQRRTPDHWREIISGQQASGLSIAAYCRQHGISQQSLFNWRRRFGADAGKPSPAFVEVKAASARSAGGIRICLRGRRRLVVQRGFDRELLVQVIGALEGLSTPGQSRLP